MIRICCVCLAMLFLSCESKTDISGHWVSLEYFENKDYHTLDIADTVIIIDKYGSDKVETSLIRQKDYFEVFFWSEYGYSEIKVKKDTLKFINPPFDDSTYFVRVDSVLTYRSDVFCDQLVEIDLPEVTNDSLISFPPRSLTSYLTIGNLKKGHQLVESQIRPDSFLLQVNDIFIPFTELPSYLDNEKAKLDETDRSKIILCIHADKNVPKFFLDQVVRTVKDYDSSLKVYQGFIDWKNRSIYYRRFTQ